MPKKNHPKAKKILITTEEILEPKNWIIRNKQFGFVHFDRVVPKRIHPKAKKILITTEEILEPGAKTVSKFHHVETVATMEQERLMLALALEQGILAVFSHLGYDRSKVLPERNRNRIFKWMFRFRYYRTGFFKMQSGSGLTRTGFLNNQSGSGLNRTGIPVPVPVPAGYSGSGCTLHLKRFLPIPMQVKNLFDHFKSGVTAGLEVV